MITISIKPLSVNRAWKGRRFKTNFYKSYEKQVLILLPSLEVPSVKLKLSIEVGFSNKGSDLDNIAKPFIDILQKKYGFNDSKIYQLTLLKKIVSKGNEYIKFNIAEI